jgi:hypothetical protein
MHLFGGIGILFLIIGGLLNVYLLVLKIMGQDIWGRPILILGAILFLGGIQLLTFGIITELIMRVYYESQHKETYRIRKVILGMEATAKTAEASR